MRNLLTFFAFATVLLVVPADGQVTYNYTGNNFTLFSCGGSSLCGTAGPNANTSYKSTDKVTGTLTLDAPLPPNLNLQDLGSYSGFTLVLNDGEQTMTATGTSTGYEAKVSTDASGQIIAPWSFIINCCQYPNNGIATLNWTGGRGVADSGVLSAPTASYPNTPLNEGFVAAHPGTWSGGGATTSSYPTGGFIRVTQCCDGVDDKDEIWGDIAKTKVWAYAGSNYGYSVAGSYFNPIVLNGTTATNNGPSAGALSFANLGAGFGRAIAFATFTNNTGQTNLNANAVLNGEFVQAPFGLPNGTLRAGGVVRVFDSDKFDAALDAAVKNNMTVGQFLLGGYTASVGRDPDTGFGNLNSILSAALISDPTASSAHAVYANGPFNPPAPISRDLSVPFTIGLGKNFTVMFDVVASSAGAGYLGWSYGSGYVDFHDTLKPATNFFTDADGNPVTGIGVVNEFSSLPIPPSVITLTPPTGSLLMENPYTVTAKVLDGDGVPVPNVPVKFTVTDGPDKGVAGASVSDASGIASYTYVGTGGTGTDTIQSAIGTLVSNNVTVTWQPARCPQPQGYWKNHPQAWPVDSLTLGAQSYSKDELLSILAKPGGADASAILAVQLIASELDVANGSDPTPIRNTVISANDLLSTFNGKLPFKTKTNSVAGQAMTQASSILGSYNNGQLTPSCTAQ